MISLPDLLSARSPLPLYRQLYEGVSAAVRDGRLSPGTRMPGKRSLAAQLGVSVSTVDAAYQQLAAEGYLESRPRSGFYVMDCAGLPAPAALPALPAPPPAPRWRFDLGTSGADPALFPFRTWGRIQKELLYSRPELLGRGHGQGDEALRAALAAHLEQYRGVRCTSEQIVVGAGIEYLLGLLAHLLGPSPLVAVEDPGYRRARRVLENEGVPCVCVPVDRQGLSVEQLAAGKANVAYVTPSHQFPTGAVMPAARRAALLRWAARQPGRLVIEDDYDSEFRFATRPLPSLQGMAGGQGVAYVGTFSQSLAPSIRIAYMVLPPPLLEAYRERYGSYASTVSRFEQQTLCRFLTEGHFSRHLARLRSRYQKRAAALTAALAGAFPAWPIRGAHTGLHLLLEVPDREAERVAAARAAGIRLSGLAEYAAQPPQRAGVVLGYGALPDADLPDAVQALAEAWRGM